MVNISPMFPELVYSDVRAEYSEACPDSEQYSGVFRTREYSGQAQVFRTGSSIQDRLILEIKELAAFIISEILNKA